METKFKFLCQVVTPCLVLFGLLSAVNLSAQNAPIPLNSPSTYLLDRMILLGRCPMPVHSAIKPFDRSEVFDAAWEDVDSSIPYLSSFDQQYLLAENDEFYMHRTPGAAPLLVAPPVSKHSFLKIFYRRPAHFYAFDDSSFYLRVNPILQFGIGKESDRSGAMFVNRRGIEIRGGIDRSVYFMTNIIEAQVRPGSHVERFVERFRALPDAGLFKDFDSRLFDSDGAYDYLSSTGVVGFQVLKHIGIQLGHGKHFIGDGYRSLFISDFAKNAFFLRLNTRVWKFHYQNLFTELAATEKLPGNVVIPKKYMAAHYLSLNVSPGVSIGLFEAVIFARDDGFELQYLNPVILYRTIEHHVGSPDNVLLGLSGKWEIKNRLRLYGQFLVDEFKFDEFFSSRQWWGNKYGIQAGAYYVDAFGVSNLDVRLEYNRVRPFTYTHYDSLGSYSHFNQALANPLGANFNEVLLKVDYRPLSRLWLTAKCFAIKAGSDTKEVFYGEDILRSNSERNADYGISQRQGIPVDNVIISLSASYMLRHNFFLEAQYFRRDYQSELAENNLLTQYFTIGLRWNYFGSQDEF